jgi:hypothetical protein
MLVLSNRRLGPATELLVSREVGAAMLRAVAEVARPRAASRWERELVAWLESRAVELPPAIDVMDLAWSPEHFERQRGFVLAAIAGVERTVHGRVLERWARMIEAHPRESVQVGRRWTVHVRL